MTAALALPTDADILEDLLKRAKKAGADEADAILGHSTSLNASVRMGETELVERSESSDIGLRVIKGKKQACISGSDFRPAALTELVERVMMMVEATPEDPFVGLAEPSQLARDWKVPDLVDHAPAAAEDLIRRAAAAEAAALSVKGVTNTEGGSASWGRMDLALMASNGFFGGYGNTSSGTSVTAIAGSGTSMEQDGVYEGRTYASDLPSPEEIGQKAGTRAVKKLGPRKVPTKKVPVIFSPEQASHLFFDFASAINGASIARGTSFLKDQMGKAVLGPGVTVIDDPFLPRGARSKPFDAEGLLPERRVVVEDGKLTTWLLDLRSARKLGLKPTGHGSRGVGSPPSPSATNMWIEPGRVSPEELIRGVKDGLYLTDIIGHGLNLVTGDYSRGAVGFWVEDGELAFPVSEITIAGNLKDMFLSLTPADDLVRRYGLDAPTSRIDGMTVAGV